MNQHKVQVFRDVVKMIKKPRVIQAQNLYSYRVVAQSSPFSGALAMQKVSRSKTVFSDAFKDDLLTLLKLAISEESFEMDPYSTESVHNAAHQIIYKNIYQKFEDIRLHRVSFEDEKVNLYRIAINKYSSELSENT